MEIYSAFDKNPEILSAGIETGITRTIQNF